MRRATLFTANIARMPSVTRRIRWSLIVIHDNSARTAYAASAMARRFTRNRFTRQRSFEDPGAQGRIRTSVPRKEEQIYSLPALTTHPPVQKCRACGIRQASPGFAHARRGSCLAAYLAPKQKNGNCARPGALRTPHLEKLPYGVLLENCRATAPRKCPAFRNHFSGAGEGI